MLVEHGGQVGMMFEMYKNYTGFSRLLKETVECTIEKEEWDKKENGDLFEMKMSLSLGRSLSQSRDLASKSSRAREDGSCVDEFANKLF
ncbi:hypothetical protein Ancab_004866 [Ancistrocladus abbreviatus]